MQEKQIISNLLGGKVLVLDKIGGGRNSQVYQVVLSDERQYAAKFYFRHQQDKRNRLAVEYRAYSFLWENSIPSVPRTIAADEQSGCAIYEFIEGENFTKKTILPEHIDQAVDFLIALKSLISLEESLSLPLASEACMSITEIIQNIQQRMTNLLATDRNASPLNEKLHQFLAEDFIPFFDLLKFWCEEQYARVGLKLAGVLPLQHRTLSPSDFGFHNAIRRENGDLAYVDFEYFGWDDPAKAVGDFLLHPNLIMQLEKPLKQQFVTRFVDHFCTFDPTLPARIKVTYPLFGMKWITILLNEFIPKDIERRAFAESGLDLAARREGQLHKVSAMLQRIQSEYEEFPYQM